jgi:hypothetical protein
VLTKSRWRLTKSSGRGLGDRVIEDDGDMCRDHGGDIADTLSLKGFLFGLGPKTGGKQFLGLSLKTRLEF